MVMQQCLKIVGTNEPTQPLRCLDRIMVVEVRTHVLWCLHGLPNTSNQLQLSTVFDSLAHCASTDRIFDSGWRINSPNQGIADVSGYGG